MKVRVPSAEGECPPAPGATAARSALVDALRNRKAMTDNPAVRAVAWRLATRLGHAVQSVAPPLAGPNTLDIADDALSALASSQEVRNWLVDCVRTALKDSGELAFGEWSSLSEFVVDRTLDALGGGE